MKPFDISFDVGIGDFLNAESFWSAEKKAALATIHHAFMRHGGSKSLIEAMRACPAFRHVEHRQLEYPTQLVPGAWPCLRDHAISYRLTYHGSAFLRGPLDIEMPFLRQAPLSTGRPFAYIQPDTPKNGEFCTRFLQDGEWPHVIALLEEKDLLGLVVNQPGGKSRVPIHPRLCNWTGRTSYPQAIEILKRAEAYIGVDSNLAILSAQLFPPDRLFVRCNNPYLVDFPWLTYPPLTDYSFLYPRFGQPPHKVRRALPEKGEIVELRCNALIGTRNYGGGGRVEVEPDRAARMIAAGQAVAVEDLED